MADIKIPNNDLGDTCGPGETLTITFTQDYTLCCEHPEAFIGPMGGLPVGQHPANYTWMGHPNPDYHGSGVVYCFQPGGVPCQPCKAPASPGTFAGHIIHIGNMPFAIPVGDARALLESLESVANSETFQTSWPATKALLHELISLKKHPLPEAFKGVMALLLTDGEAAYEHAVKKHRG